MSQTWRFQSSVLLFLNIWENSQLIASLPKFKHFLSGSPGGSDGKESACSVRDPGSVPGLGRTPGEGNGYPLQYSDLENSMDCIVHGVTKSRTWLSDFHFTSPLVSPMVLNRGNSTLTPPPKRYLTMSWDILDCPSWRWTRLVPSNRQRPGCC